MGLGLKNLDGLVRIKAHLERAARLDCTPLMAQAQVILREDNERGLRAGLDCNDQKMPATQREQDSKQARKKGSGPPLAPSYEQSRVINAQTVRTDSSTRPPWVATLRWVAFDDDKGKPILAYHRDAQKNHAPYPTRDVISHPRPAAVQKFRALAVRWFREQLRYKP